MKKIVFLVILLFPVFLFAQENNDTLSPARVFVIYTNEVLNSYPDISLKLMQEKIIESFNLVNDALEKSTISNILNPPIQKFEIARLFYNNNNSGQYQNYNYFLEIYGPDFKTSISYTNSGECGQSDGMIPFTERGLVTIEYNCLPQTLAHEYGHVMGCKEHSGSLFYYNNETWGSLMTYTFPRASIYSGPGIYYPDKDASPKSEVYDNNSNHNNAEIILTNRSQIRSLYQTPTNIILLYDGYDEEIINSYEIADLLAKSKISTSPNFKYICEANSKVKFRAGSEIRIRPGFWAKLGSEFHAFINDGQIRNGKSKGFSRSFVKSKEDVIQKSHRNNYVNNCDLKFYPNPASEYIEIKPYIGLHYSEVSEVSIYNSFGELILSEVLHLGDVGHLKRIDISHLPIGVYYIKTGIQTKMFVKL